MMVRSSTYCKNELPGMLRTLAKAMSARLTRCRPLTATMMGGRNA